MQHGTQKYTSFSLYVCEDGVCDFLCIFCCICLLTVRQTVTINR